MRLFILVSCLKFSNLSLLFSLFLVFFERFGWFVQLFSEGLYSESKSDFEDDRLEQSTGPKEARHGQSL